MDSDDMMKALRDHLGRDPIGVLAHRLHQTPEAIMGVLKDRPAQLLDLTEDDEIAEAILAYIVARARRS